MQIIETKDMYSWLLEEAEWYGISMPARVALIDQCRGAAMDRDCKYAAILVQPDAVLSVSPIPNRHRVMHYTKPMPAVEQFREELKALRAEALKAGVPLQQIAIVANEVFE